MLFLNDFLIMTNFKNNFKQNHPLYICVYFKIKQFFKKKNLFFLISYFRNIYYKFRQSDQYYITSKVDVFKGKFFLHLHCSSFMYLSYNVEKLNWSILTPFFLILNTDLYNLVVEIGSGVVYRIVQIDLFLSFTNWFVQSVLQVRIWFQLPDCTIQYQMKNLNFHMVNSLLDMHFSKMS